MSVIELYEGTDLTRHKGVIIIFKISNLKRPNFLKSRNNSDQNFRKFEIKATRIFDIGRFNFELLQKSNLKRPDISTSVALNSNFSKVKFKATGYFDIGRFKFELLKSRI